MSKRKFITYLFIFKIRYVTYLIEDLKCAIFYLKHYLTCTHLLRSQRNTDKTTRITMSILTCTTYLIFYSRGNVCSIPQNREIRWRMFDGRSLGISVESYMWCYIIIRINGCNTDLSIVYQRSQQIGCFSTKAIVQFISISSRNFETSVAASQ